MMKKYKFDIEQVKESLKDNKHDNNTAAYYILLKSLDKKNQDDTDSFLDESDVIDEEVKRKSLFFRLSKKSHDIVDFQKSDQCYKNKENKEVERSFHLDFDHDDFKLKKTKKKNKIVNFEKYLFTPAISNKKSIPLNVKLNISDEITDSPLQKKEFGNEIQSIELEESVKLFDRKKFK